MVQSAGVGVNGVYLTIPERKKERMEEGVFV